MCDTDRGRRRRHRARRRFAFAGLLLLLLGLPAAVWIRFGPVPASVLRPAPANDYVLVDRRGEPLGQASAVVAEPPRDGTPLAVRADRLAAATLAAEDERFRRHPGVDGVALVRVGLTNIRRRELSQGGSTITQQLVKLRLGRRGRSLSSKAWEMIYAVRLEGRMSKTEILSAYLAEAPYGGRVVGAEAASRLYFGKPASQLSWAEAAFLAALPQRPTAYDPSRDPTAARQRQRWILGRLAGSGKITEGERRAALATPVQLAARNGSTGFGDAPHLVEMVSSRLRAARAPGGMITTTIDAQLQRDVAGIARHHREVLAAKGASNVAVVVLDNASGSVRAWEGSGDYLDWDAGGMINGPLVPRQTGSTIKPFIYAVAFELGAAPGDRAIDRPVTYTWNGQAFKPENYDRRFRGEISLRTALGSSVNVVAVQLLKQHTPAAVGDLLTKMQMATPRDPRSYGLSLGLGAAEIDLLSLTRAYAAFGRGGTLPPVRFVQGGPPERAGGGRVMSEAASFLVTDVLRDNAARAPAFGERSALVFDFPVAAKTGTSQDFHDNWVVGYTDDVTVGVWVGNFNRAPLAKGATGVSGAGPIFHAVMQAAHDRLTPERSGQNSLPYDGVEPPAALTLVAQCESERCVAPRFEYEWRKSPASGRPSARSPSAGSRSTRPARIELSGLRLATPVPGGQYVVDPTKPLRDQLIGLEALGGQAPYRYTVDGARVVPTSEEGRADAPVLWPLAPGLHEACVTDATQRQSCAKFRVL